MTEAKTFFDLPIEYDYYCSRPYANKKPPIRLLIADGNYKFLSCLLYRICSGAVFGEDQELYIHLVNAKGVVDNKAIFLELQECGFSLLKGWLVTSKVDQAYKDVDVVLIVNIFEEQFGVTPRETLAGLIIRGRHMMSYIADYSKPNTKVILLGTSTKYILTLLWLLHRLEPRIRTENMTAVTILDEAIARSHLAARLKTTTNKIKNIVIWGMTCPDVHNATVRMLPPGDLGALEEEDIPVREALQDDNYLHGEFVESIFRRKIGHDFSRSGKSLALAASRHLRALFIGAENDEIVSMGVISPSSEPFGIPHGFPASFPVDVPGNGSWKVREDVKYDVRTHLNLIRTIHRLLTDEVFLNLNRVIEHIIDHEEEKNDLIGIDDRMELTAKLDLPCFGMIYLAELLPTDAMPNIQKEKLKARKSIAWSDTHKQGAKKSEEFQRRSSIWFGSDDTKKRDRKGSILKTRIGNEANVLPHAEK